MEVIFHGVPAAGLQIGSSGVSVLPRPLGFYASYPVNYAEHPPRNIYLCITFEGI